MHTPRIAYCSPVNPAPSGISDYSEELLPYLGQYADITLYIEDGLKPTDPRLAQHLALRPLKKLAGDHKRRPFDAILYHMGNSPVHAQIWRMAQRVPGVVVLHDFVLHHFMLWYAANAERNVQAYVQRMRSNYGAAGEHVAQLMIRSRFSEAAFEFPCSEAVLHAAHGLIAHSRYVIERAAAVRPDLPSAAIPMGVPLPALTPKTEARARLGLPADQAVLASFGHINAYKRMESALRALAALRAEGRDAHYVLVGSVSANYDLKGLVQRMGLSDAVTITGYAPRHVFEDYVAAADICLNLRHPTGGETSASLLRLLGAGKPTLVTATGSFAELPAGTVAPVDLDESEGETILAYCRALLDQPALAEGLGGAARAFVAREHSLERSAEEYARFLAKHYGWPALYRVRSAPLWNPTPQPQSPAPPKATAPAAPPPPPLSGTALAVAQAAAEIGLLDSDDAPLKTVAAVLGELGELGVRN